LSPPARGASFENPGETTRKKKTPSCTAGRSAISPIRSLESGRLLPAIGRPRWSSYFPDLLGTVPLYNLRDGLLSLAAHRGDSTSQILSQKMRRFRHILAHGLTLTHTTPGMAPFFNNGCSFIGPLIKSPSGPSFVN